MSVLTVHWSPVRPEENGAELFALWPAPVNDDVCFREAGFTDFGDADDRWDVAAEGVHDRLLGILSRYGEPTLLSKPVERARSWFQRLFRKAETFGISEQIMVPIMWDSQPDCVVAFGSSGVKLRTGNGHHIYWVTVPATCRVPFREVAYEAAGPHSLVKTNLRWEYLA